MPPGGVLQACLACTALSKPLTPRLQAELATIYGGYDPYYQGGGAEQLVHDARGGSQLRRSEVLCRRLKETGLLRRRGHAVDVGCGNGGFLRALARALDGWTLEGLELDGRHRDRLAEIPGFSGLQEGDATALRGRFDLISMIHALEHFPEPGLALQALQGHLEDGGLVFVEVPDVQANPFDLLIADHVTHFTPATLGRLLARSGLAPRVLETGWVQKECSALAGPGPGPVASSPPPAPSPAGQGAAQIGWLLDTLEAARRAATAGRPFGLFGTSIAATWLGGALGGAVGFYVDEDSSRQGRSFFERPILAPEGLPPDAVVFVGLAPAIAGVVAERLRRASPTTSVVLPPPLGHGNAPGG